MVDRNYKDDHYRDDFARYYDNMTFEEFKALPSRARVRINELITGFTTALGDLRNAHTLLRITRKDRNEAVALLKVERRTNQNLAKILGAKREVIRTQDEHIRADHDILRMVWEAHGPDERGIYCKNDGFLHPCSTRNILNGNYSE